MGKPTGQMQEDTQELLDHFNSHYNWEYNEMSYDDMASYIRDIWMMDGSLNDPYELEFEINSYDDNLYDILVPYVKDEEGSYEVMQEFIHDRREQF